MTVEAISASYVHWRSPLLCQVADIAVKHPQSGSSAALLWDRTRQDVFLRQTDRRWSELTGWWRGSSWGLRLQTIAVQQRGTTKVSMANNSWARFLQRAVFDEWGTWYQLFNCSRTTAYMTFNISMSSPDSSWHDRGEWSNLKCTEDMCHSRPTCEMCFSLIWQIRNTNMWHSTSWESMHKREKVITHSLML